MFESLPNVIGWCLVLCVCYYHSARVIDVSDNVLLVRGHTPTWTPELEWILGPTGALLSQLRCVRSLLIMVAWWQQRCFRSPVRQGDSGACHGKPILLPDNILGHPVRLADYYIPITWTMNNNIITLDTIEWGPRRFPVKIHFIFIASFFSKDIQ